MTGQEQTAAVDGLYSHVLEKARSPFLCAYAFSGAGLLALLAAQWVGIIDGGPSRFRSGILFIFAAFALERMLPRAPSIASTLGLILLGGWTGAELVRGLSGGDLLVTLLVSGVGGATLIALGPSGWRAAQDLMLRGEQP